MSALKHTFQLWAIISRAYGWNPFVLLPTINEKTFNLWWLCSVCFESSLSLCLLIFEAMLASTFHYKGSSAQYFLSNFNLSLHFGYVQRFNKRHTWQYFKQYALKTLVGGFWSFGHSWESSYPMLQVYIPKQTYWLLAALLLPRRYKSCIDLLIQHLERPH